MYDIETKGVGNLDFVMIGFFDGCEYHCFRDLADFFDHVLRAEYCGWRIFAHFGGRFDIHFLFDWLRSHMPTTDFEFFCSGSAVISFTVRIDDEHWWRFSDSYRLMDKSLQTLTKEFDTPHKKLPFAPLDWRYNRNDCMGLYEVLTKFFDEFDITSETIASHALRVWRSRFLEFEIPTISKDVDLFCRRAYYGGRCEIFRFDKADVFHHDINSLYPWAMLFPLPIEKICRSRRLPDDDDSEIGFYDATVDYPELYVPSMPFRGDKLYFPVGAWRGNFTSMDIRQAIEDGAAVTIHDGLIFRAEPIMATYVAELHKMKQQADRDGDLGKRLIYKKLMNSLYGKTGQKLERRSYCLDPGTDRLYRHPDHPRIWPLEKSPGIAWYVSQSHGRHILPHIAAAVTSRARLRLLEFLRQPGRIWYTDTDSLFIDREIPAGVGLGEMELKGKGSFEAWALKEYEFKSELFLKGVPMTRMDEETGEKIRDEALARAYCQGKEIRLPRMAGFMESIRKGLPTVRMVEVTRQRRKVLGKRCQIGQDTRPWRVDELP